MTEKEDTGVDEMETNRRRTNEPTPQDEINRENSSSIFK
jgi:hypothetical protein